MGFVFNPFTGNFDFTGSGSEAKNFNIVTQVAQSNISALKLVKLNSSGLLIYADNSNYNDSNVLGLSLNAGSFGSDINVLTFGEIEDSSFNFAIDSDLFLGSNGEIIEVAPTSGVYLKIGNVIKTNTIFISIKQSIERV
jgi:hypothetical protein